MHVPISGYHRPQSVEEACRLLDATTDAVLLAGGTDLLVDLKLGKRRCGEVISINDIAEIRSIDVKGGRLVIGSAVTHSQVVDSHLVRNHWPALSEAAETIGTGQIRNSGTVGGNLCTAASCADTAPILIALGAEIEIAGRRDRRVIPLSDFFVEHRKTVLGPTEIVTRVLVPLPIPGTGACYEKFGLRQAANIAVASVAVLVRLVAERCAEARAVMGAVAPTPKISLGAGELIVGRTRDELTTQLELREAFGRAVSDEAEPIDDIRGSASFRRHLVAVLARRALERALERAVTP